MRTVPLFGFVALVAHVAAAAASGDPSGVWTPVKRDSVIERIHVSGSPLDYIATIDYRCGAAVCSTFQSLNAEGGNPPTFSLHLDGIGPAPVLALRWQKGPPCNRAGSDESPLAWWTAAIHAPAGKKEAGAAGRVICLVRLPAPPASRQR
jgi:hypothetical protein